MGNSWWDGFSSRLRNTAFDPALLDTTLKSESLNADIEPDALCPETLICVDISLQTLSLVVEGLIVDRYSISTSKYGAGCRQNTGCTPLGWHYVAEKIGADAPVGTIFKGRRVTGLANNLRSDAADDLITSRILWLGGLQNRFNAGGQVDSKNRYIYIHGTAQEHLLGEPVSEGCIRMANNDVLELFRTAASDTLVFIE